MAANMSDHILPTLPNEILITVIRSLEWTEDVDQLRFMWEDLRVVSPMFKTVVEKIFAARNMPSPTELLRLLPTTSLFLPDFGSSPTSLFQADFDEPLGELRSPDDIDAPFNRVSADGRAIFHFRDFVDSQEQSEFLIIGSSGLHVSMGNCRFVVTDIVEYDPGNQEFLISWEDLYAAYRKELNEIEESRRWVEEMLTRTPPEKLDLAELNEMIKELQIDLF